MHTGKDIRRRVDPVQELHRLNKNTVPGQLRPEVLSVGIYIGYDQEDRHPHAQRPQKLIVFFIAAVKKCKVKDRSDKEKVPDHIRNNEVFTKRDLIIHKGMDKMRLYLALFHKHK